nr:MAG TPA: hypothetical protein [Caudoviricetes sp.]DAX82495.1 MAG TPA: hypothetical protein [Caudoviricetes sp.]
MFVFFNTEVFTKSVAQFLRKNFLYNFYRQEK